jgi:hypothetical protein
MVGRQAAPSSPGDLVTDPLVPPTIDTEEEWREFQVFQIYQQTRHLDRIRVYTGWLLALVAAGTAIGIVLGIVAAVAAGEATAYGY